MTDEFEKLGYQNRFVKKLSQTIEGADCFSAFADLDTDSNLIVLDLSMEKFTRMWSALVTGADIVYPDESHQIMVDFLKGLHCPPNVDGGDSGCIEYSPAASFIKYFPDSPFIAGDVSPGWNKEAWFRWSQFDTLFPDWIDNWIGGLIDALTGYQTGDILFNIESVPINPIDALINGGFLLPKIEIKFAGTGTVEVELLSFPLGGKAIIELDQEPNALDILTGGILDPGAFLVELNRDIFNFPPDEYPVVNVEIPVENPGNHTLYIVFIPIVDDSLLPVGFGGGLRSVELCGFEEQGTVGIEQIIWDGCELKAITGGIESTIVTAAQIQACLDIPEPEPGGGGSGALKTLTYQWKHATNTVATSSNTYSQVFSIPHTFEYPNFLLIVEGLAVLAGTATHWLEVEFTLDGVSGIDTIPAAALANINREFGYSNRWANVETGIIKQIELKIRSRVNGQSVTFLNQNTISVTIIEFGNPDDLFVQDVRELDGVIQKKIGGVWFDVWDAGALIEAAQSTANAALSIANSANATNVTQQNQINNIIAVNNNQNTRLNDLETFEADATLSLSQLSLTVNDHEARIDALEAASGVTSDYFTGGVWSENLTWSDGNVGDWIVLDGNPASVGVASTIANPSIVNLNSPPFRNNQVTHVGVKLVRLGHTNPMAIQAEISSNDPGRFTQDVAAAGEHILWMRVHNLTQGGMNLAVSSLSSDRFYVRGLILLGRGVNPF